MSLDDDHPARQLSDAERVDYVTVVASFAAADDRVDDSEVAPLLELGRELGVSESVVRAAVASAADRAAVDAAIARLARHIDLRTRLLTDAIVIVFADDAVAAAESTAIAALGRALSLKPAQIGLLARYVQTELGQGGDLPETLGAGVAAAEQDRPSGGAIRWLHGLFRRKR